MSDERERLAPEIFRLPVEKIRDAYYSDTYFALTKELLEAEGERPRVTMQVFAKRQGLATVYDSLYVVLAQMLGGELWTADQRLLAAVRTRATKSCASPCSAAAWRLRSATASIICCAPARVRLAKSLTPAIDDDT